MMQYIVTEDTIKRALDESINEFMINEGWGDAFRSAWNGVKNAAAMYMDWRTNGQWNKKYGVYVNGNTKMGELYYLNKWFNYYREELSDIIYKANVPNRRDSYDIWERDPKTGKETMRKNRYDYVGYEGAIEYAKQYCTFQNFNDYIRTINPDRYSVGYINSYIYNYITKPALQGIKNLNLILNNLNINTFYASDQGKKYLEMNRAQQQKHRANMRQQSSNSQRPQAQQPSNSQQSQVQQPQAQQPVAGKKDQSRSYNGIPNILNGGYYK